MRKVLFVFVAAAFLMLSAVPAVMAQDEAVSISGNVHLETFWNDRDSTLTSQVNGFPSGSDTDLLWQVNPVTTNLNFNFKAGDISATVVGRPAGTSFGADWFASWNFGAGQLIVGNINNPAWRPFSSLSVRVANSPWYGAIDAVKQTDQLQVVFPIGGGTLRFGALKPGTSSVTVLSTSAFVIPGSKMDIDNTIPKLEASYDMRFGGLNLWIGGGWQTVTEVVQSTSYEQEFDIDSYLLGLYASYGFGPVTVNGNYWIMKNPQSYGFSGNPAPFNSPGGPAGTPTLTVLNSYDMTANDIIDVDYWGWHISAGWKISDMLTLQAGYGLAHWERNANASIGEVRDPEDERSMYYVNLPIFAAKGFTITPEIGVYDEKDYTPGTGTITNIDQGKTTYYGVKWLIRF